MIARLVRERDEARTQLQTQRTALAQAQAAAPAAAAAAVEGETRGFRVKVLACYLFVSNQGGVLCARACWRSHESKEICTKATMAACFSAPRPSSTFGHAACTVVLGLPCRCRALHAAAAAGSPRSSARWDRMGWDGMG